MAAYADRSRATESAPLRVWVDRERARFGAWYEMFPRSAGPDPRRSGTFREARRRAAAHRRPRLRRPLSAADSPDRHELPEGPQQRAQSPAPAIPAARGRSARRPAATPPSSPALGTLEDFDAFRREAERLGWRSRSISRGSARRITRGCASIPEWFRHRPDGTIKYAENPPKKYQDIYPFDFECDDWRALWQALLDVTLFWVDRGVRIFRVDNPHTKTLGFWEWLIDQVHAAASRRHLPLGGVHAAAGDALPREGRLHAVVHLLHLAQHEGGADRVLHRADDERGARVPAAEPLRQHARHPARLPAARRTAGVRGAAAPGGDARRELRHLQRLRARARARRSPAPRSTPTRRSISSGNGTGTGPATSPSSSAASTRSATRTARCSSTRTLRFHATDNPEIIAYSKRAPGRSDDRCS